MPTRRPSLAATLASTLLLVACGGSNPGTPPPPPATNIAKTPTNSGDNQVGPAGQPLPNALRVLVTDAQSAPVANVSVAWGATGGGSLPATSSSDANGIAVATWTLGANAGAQSATASKTGLTGSPVTFGAVAQVQGATQLAKAPAISGDGQTDTVFAMLPNPYRVIARDQNNAPVQGVVVNWTVTSGGGSVPSPTSTTDINGIAVITHTFGSTVGAQSVQASVTGLIGSPVTFTSTATPGIPTQIAKTATANGDN